jgi:Cu-Zn family superoxide dismutase
MKKSVIVFVVLVAALWACTKAKDPNVIEMHALTAQGVGERIGSVRVADTPYGTLFTPDLHNLTPGLHGFHLHTEGNCGPGEKDGKMVPGLAAGGHYDPAGTGTHKGPYGDGHLGDLPALYVDENGRATHPVLAPRIKLSDLRGRSLMIHAGGDNYADHPKPLGGGGDRVACGVISN